MSNRRYYGFDGWATDDYSSIARSFAADVGPEPELVYAVYSTPAYEGHATVIFRRDGKWYEAGGGHCSCYGLEGQWEPKEIDPNTHLAALAMGKRELLVYDTGGDYPEATPEAFNDWLRSAMQNAMG